MIDRHCAAMLRLPPVMFACAIVGATLAAVAAAFIVLAAIAAAISGGF